MGIERPRSPVMPMDTGIRISMRLIPLLSFLFLINTSINTTLSFLQDILRD
jgi:hypothetical protein